MSDVPLVGALVVTPDGDTVVDGWDTDPLDPTLRAQARLDRLTTGFTQVLQTLAQMYQDEDWRYLHDDDGAPYGSMAALVAHRLGKSLSMSRRYVQGARELMVPLLELTAADNIHVTSADVAALGTDGSAEVLDRVRDRIAADPDADHGNVIDTAIQEVRQERSRRDEWDDNDDGGSSPRAARSKTPAGGGGDGWDDEPFGGFSNDGVTIPDDSDIETPHEDRPPRPAYAVAPSEFADTEGDVTEAILAGCQDYRDPGARAQLPPEVASVTAALVTLADMDPAKVASAVDYDTRGVLAVLRAARETVALLESRVETSAWFMSRIA